MKLQITIEIVSAKDISNSFRNIPREMMATLGSMPDTEKDTKSVIFVESFPPRLIDNKAIHRYFPMLVARTFRDALALLRDCDNLYMARGAGLKVSWSKLNNTFLDKNGSDWVPSPEVILSDKEEWYVYSEVKSDQKEAKFPDF